MNYARIINNVAVDVSPDPTNHFTTEIASQFVEVPDNVGAQWVLAGGVWTAPPAASVAVSYRKQLSRVEFKMMFTAAEYVAIQAARSYSGTDAGQKQLAASLDFFFDVLDDPALTFVDLSLPFVIDGVNSLVTAGLLTQERADTILAGVA